MENLPHSQEWIEGYAAGREDGYDVGYQDGTEDGPQTMDRLEKGEPHSMQNLDARIFRIEQVLSALLQTLGYGGK
jgi:flagellar biosynthesis/type III secretory pathway protein FliH